MTVGELDLCLPERFSRELAAASRARPCHVIREQGHQPFQEGPEEYNALLAEFWSSVPAG